MPWRTSRRESSMQPMLWRSRTPFCSVWMMLHMLRVLKVWFLVKWLDIVLSPADCCSWRLQTSNKLDKGKYIPWNGTATPSSESADQHFRKKRCRFSLAVKKPSTWSTCFSTSRIWTWTVSKKEQVQNAKDHMKTLWLSDCRSLTDHLTNPALSEVQGHRLAIDLTSLRQETWRAPHQEIGYPTFADALPPNAPTVIRWISTKTMVADGLTKTMRCEQLLELMRDGELKVKMQALTPVKKDGCETELHTCSYMSSCAAFHHRWQLIRASATNRGSSEQKSICTAFAPYGFDTYFYPILSHIIPYYLNLSHIIPYYRILSHQKSFLGIPMTMETPIDNHIFAGIPHPWPALGLARLLGGKAPRISMSFWVAWYYRWECIYIYISISRSISISISVCNYIPIYIYIYLYIFL